MPNVGFVRIRQKPGLHMHAARLDSGRPPGLSGDRRATTDVAMAVCAACMLLEGGEGDGYRKAKKMLEGLPRNVKAREAVKPTRTLQIAAISRGA